MANSQRRCLSCEPTSLSSDLEIRGKKFWEPITDSWSIRKFDRTVLHRETSRLKFSSQRRIKDFGRSEFNEWRDR